MIKKIINNIEIIYFPDTLQLYYKVHTNDSNGIGDLQSKKSLLKKERSKNLLLRFLITNNCNMRCEYCQMRKLFDGKTLYLTKEIIDTIIQVIELQTYDYVTVHFSGGEPLLAMDIIEYACIKFLNVLHGRVRFAMSTNGTLISEKNIETIKKFNIQTVISIDGNESDNSYRSFSNGVKTYNTLIKKINLLGEADVPIGLSMVYTGQKVEDIISCLKRINDNNKIESLGFNYLHYPAFEKKEEELQMYAKSLWKIYKYCRNNNIFEEQSNRIIEPFVFSAPRLSHCSSTSSQITIGPNGLASPCKTFLTGNIDVFDYKEINNDRGMCILNKWRHETCDNIDDCKNCDYRYLCGAGCRYEAFVDSGSIGTKDARYCCVVKYFFERILEELLVKGAFEDATSDYQLLSFEKKKILLSSSKVSKYGLTSSIGHFLE